MDEQRTIEEYNYSIFEGQGDFLTFRAHLQVGSPAPDFPALLLER
jgi:hypothetical protein